MNIRAGYDRLHMEIGQKVPEAPSQAEKGEFLSGKANGACATVRYIHPEGRYYVVWVPAGNSGYTETRNFTPEEIEEGRRIGVFRMPSRSLSTPRMNVSVAPRLRGFQSIDRSVDNMNLPMGIDDIDAAEM